MADRTARDAVIDAYRPVTISVTHARAVLAALGIDPDTPTDDVKAGLWLLRNDGAFVREASPGNYSARRRTDYGELDDTFGHASRAAAVLALAARLEKQ